MQPLRSLAIAGFTYLMMLAAPPSAVAQQWTAPTPEELSMTSQPQAPGASAVYLYREEKTDDPAQTYSEYVRLKVLTEGGKDLANVELKYVSEGYTDYSVGDIAGRTIHPDGTVIPFSGKPYERTVEKEQGYKLKSKVFTLPDVTVGSIIEYRYKLHWNYLLFSSPVWLVQTDIFLREGYFFWRPLDRARTSYDERGPLTDFMAWVPILPPGSNVVVPTEAKGARRFFSGAGTTFELRVHDIAASPVEEYMPPIRDLSYRVMFYYTPYKTPDEFWTGQGLHWSKDEDKFIGPGPVVKAAVQQLVAPTDTQEQKLRKIYAAVEKVDNTYYTREHSRVEDRAGGVSETRTTDDVWTHKRGTSEQVAELFIAMARGAGLKAYLMAITDRYNGIFLKDYQTLHQLNFDLAVVTVDGKEQFFDPSSRFCPYGELFWSHSNTRGLRQTDGGTALAATTGKSYRDSRTVRVANLKMDESGEVAGRIDLKLTGAPALFWRQLALTEDRETVERELKESIAETLPGDIDVKLLSIGKLEEYEEPMTASFELKGKIGSVTGKRMFIAGDLFQTNSKPTFSHENRKLAVVLRYPYAASDAVRINLPPGFTVEGLPPDGTVKLPNKAMYMLTGASDPKGVTIRRDLYVAETLYKPEEYPELRKFYGQFEAKDKEPIILKVAATVPAGN